MERAYQILLVIVFCADYALMVGLFAKQKNEPEKGQTGTTTFTTEQTEAETTIPTGSSADTVPGTIVAETPTVDN